MAFNDWLIDLFTFSASTVSDFEFEDRLGIAMHPGNFRCTLENVAIATHCNLRPPDAVPVLIRFNYKTHAKFEAAEHIHCHLIAFLLLIHYVRL